MKVTGPSSGAPDTAPSAGKGVDGAAPAATTPAGGTAPVAPGATAGAGGAQGKGAAFAEKLSGKAAPGVHGAPGQPPVARATDAIAADLQAGRLQPRAAIEKVLEQVLARQVGADAPPAVREKVRAALLETLENDPGLADQLRSLDG